MDALQYAEDRGARTIAVLRSSYDDLHERAYKLATVLVAGGGATGAYALGKVDVSAGNLMAWLPIATLSLGWFVTAGVLVWRGATSRELSPGNGPGTLLDYYDERLGERGAGQEDSALEVTRRAEIKLEQKRVKAYELACVARATAIDLAYKMAIGTPIAAILVAAFIYRRG